MALNFWIKFEFLKYAVKVKRSDQKGVRSLLKVAKSSGEPGASLTKLT